jgi:hypothetical protein
MAVILILKFCCLFFRVFSSLIHECVGRNLRLLFRISLLCAGIKSYSLSPWSAFFSHKNNILSTLRIIILFCKYYHHIKCLFQHVGTKSTRSLSKQKTLCLINSTFSVVHIHGRLTGVCGPDMHKLNCRMETIRVYWFVNFELRNSGGLDHETVYIWGLILQNQLIKLFQYTVDLCDKQIYIWIFLSSVLQNTQLFEGSFHFYHQVKYNDHWIHRVGYTW